MQEPIPAFRTHDRPLLESALNLPRATFGGKDLYATLVKKAAILYYVLIKNHAFPNGNKRIATTTLLTFLAINEKWLNAGISELTQLAITVADSPATAKDATLAHLAQYIREHLVPFGQQR